MFDLTKNKARNVCFDFKTTYLIFKKHYVEHVAYVTFTFFLKI
jgi:hypothetical protein